MALSFTTVKDDVCRAAFSCAYSELDSYQQAIVDRFGADAEKRLGMYSRFWSMGDATAANAPTEWESWLVLHAAMTIAAVIKSDRYGGLKEAERTASETALNLFSTSEPVSGTPTDQDPNALTVRMVYKHVLMHCMKRNPRIFPNIDAIDSALQWTLNTLWNRKNWKFRSVFVTITFDKDGFSSVSPDIDLSNLIALEGTCFFCADARATRAKLVWVTADQMAELQAARPDQRGRPQAFRLDYGDSASPSWLIWPLPAEGETWSFKGSLLKPQPTPPSANDTTAGFASWPVPFRPLIKEMVLAKVLKDHGSPDGAAMMRGVEDEVDRLAPQYVEPGNAVQTVEVLDVYGDTQWLA